MMGPKMMMFFIFCFVVLTPISLMLEGGWLGSSEQTLQDQLTGMHIEQHMGLLILDWRASDGSVDAGPHL